MVSSRNSIVTILKILSLALLADLAASQVCDSRFCLYVEEWNKTLGGIDDAQRSCRTKSDKFFLLEVYDSQIFRLLVDSLLPNHTDLWKQDVLLNLVEKFSNEWKFVDEFTRMPKVLPFNISYSTSSDVNKNYMSIFKSADGFYFQPKFGHELFPVVCSRLATEEECSKENETHFYENNLCYEKIDGVFTWFQAQNECFLRNSSMSSFVNLDLNSTFSKFNQSQYWVAIAKSFWFWRDSDTYAQFSHWFLDMPSQNNTRDCVYFISQNNNNSWFRGNCQNDFAVLCMSDSQRSPSQILNEGSDVSPGVTTAIVLSVITIITVVATVVATRIITRKK